MNVLITGGAGYIGSHILVDLTEADHNIIVIDSLVNGHAEAIDRISKFTNTTIELAVGDIRDKPFLDRIFTEYLPDVVIHLAGLKSVNNSVEDPLAYYDVNVTGSQILLEVMQKHGCRKIVFSSSATVYGEPNFLPYTENHPVAPVSPYGRTKLVVENMIGDWVAAHTERSAISLRYFNPIGAHPTGLIGEHPHGLPNNLMPFITQVATNRRPFLRIFGDDYDTRDGTGERDYLHVMDLAQAHILALTALNKQIGHDIINLGTGQGITVREMVDAFQQATGQKIKTAVVKRRPGDLASFYADNEHARATLGWTAKLSLMDMCRDTWAWTCENPNGYQENSILPRKTTRH